MFYKHLYFNKLISTLLFIRILLPFPVSAQNRQETPITISLWPAGTPSGNGLTAKDEKAFGPTITRIAVPCLYVYPAEKPNGVTIMMCPGGAYFGVALGHEGTDMAGWFNSMGITYAVLKYRMPNGHYDIPLSDAEQAMRILRSYSEEWGIDIHKVGVMGASAGGHLASTLATKASSEESKPDFQILLYPVISMSEGTTHRGSRDNLLGKNPSAELIDLYSNELHISKDSPAAFMALSADDDLVPVANSIRYFEALNANGVPASLHIYPSGGHGWGFRDSFKYKREWTAELEKWLDIVIKRTR